MEATETTVLGPSDADKAKAAEALAWLETVEAGDNDYLHNLVVIGEIGRVEHRTSGLAASILTAHKRAMGEARKVSDHAKRVATSKHVGEVGKREIFTLTVTKVIPIESEYGVTRLHLMTDANGNEMKWFASAGGGFNEEATVTVKATVKGHEEYKGVKVTTLSRVAEYEPPAPKVKKVRAPKKPVATLEATAAWAKETVEAL